MEETLELKEDSMMKEEINEIVKPIPILQHVQQVKDVPIIDFSILQKFNVPIGEKDVLLSSWFQWTTKRRTFPFKIFILCQGCYTKGQELCYFNISKLELEVSLTKKE